MLAAATHVPAAACSPRRLTQEEQFEFASGISLVARQLLLDLLVDALLLARLLRQTAGHGDDCVRRLLLAARWAVCRFRDWSMAISDERRWWGGRSGSLTVTAPRWRPWVSARSADHHRRDRLGNTCVALIGLMTGSDHSLLLTAVELERVTRRLSRSTPTSADTGEHRVTIRAHGR